jgi:hypothetical protein
MYLTVACLIFASIKTQSLIELEDSSVEDNLRFLQTQPDVSETLIKAQAEADKAKSEYFKSMASVAKQNTEFANTIANADKAKLEADSSNNQLIKADSEANNAAELVKKGQQSVDDAKAILDNARKDWEKKLQI